MITEERFQELIAQGESLTVEFKGEDQGRLSDNELVEMVVCLANRAGEDMGYLLIGVEDDGRLTGAKPRHGNTIDPFVLLQRLAKEGKLLRHGVKKGAWYEPRT